MSSAAAETVHYSDGSSQAIPVTFSDWTLNGGNASVATGNTIAITTAYRNWTSGWQQSINTYVFATAVTALTAGKTVASFTFPPSSSQGRLHIFAVGFAPLFNNVGISPDSDKGLGNFDGRGWSYSATSLANAFVELGSQVDVNGVTFNWPSVTAGTLDNYQAAGQTINVTGTGDLGFLGASTNGPSSGTITIHHSDGTSQTATLSFSDWTLNGGNAGIAPGESFAIITDYRNYTNGGVETIDAYVFAANIPLASGKTVVSVTLPTSVTQDALHVFDVATSGH